MIKKWMFIVVAITVSGCVTTGGEPANIKADAAPVSIKTSDNVLKHQFETIRVVPMAYGEAWEHVIKTLPTVVVPPPPDKKVAPSKFQTFDRTTGIIKMTNFSYVGSSLPGAPKREVICKASRYPNRNSMTIRLIPAGENTVLWVSPQFSQLLREESWAPETISGRIDALGGITATRYAAHQTASAKYDQCVSTGAIENLMFKSFPEKSGISPVKSLSMGSFHKFYNIWMDWQEYQNSVPNVSAPHFLANQELYMTSATKHTRAGWEEEAASRNDGGETDSIISLGIVNAMGYGVPKNEAVAAKWFKKKASRSYIAQYNLGMLSLKGGGVPKDEADAAEWFQTASLQGGNMYTMAKNNLGVLYASGIGVKKDEAKAVKLFQEIIDVQKRQLHICNVKTIRNLGFMYENGLGVPKSESHAYGYYFAAARLGDIEAQKSKDLIQEKLSIDQMYSVLSSPEFQMADCSPLWSGGWHEVP